MFPHQLSVVGLVLVFSVIFVSAAWIVKDREGRRDSALIITATFMIGLFFERVLIAIWYGWMVYPEYAYLLPAWRLGRHLSLIVIELSLYVTAWILLRSSNKRRSSG